MAQLIQVTLILFAARRGPGKVPTASRTLANGGARFTHWRRNVTKWWGQLNFESIFRAYHSSEDNWYQDIWYPDKLWACLQILSQFWRYLKIGSKFSWPHHFGTFLRQWIYGYVPGATSRQVSPVGNPAPLITQSRFCASLSNMVGWAAHWTRAIWINCVTSYNPAVSGRGTRSTLEVLTDKVEVLVQKERGQHKIRAAAREAFFHGVPVIGVTDQLLTSGWALACWGCGKVCEKGCRREGFSCAALLHMLAKKSWTEMTFFEVKKHNENTNPMFNWLVSLVVSKRCSECSVQRYIPDACVHRNI